MLGLNKLNNNAPGLIQLEIRRGRAGGSIDSVRDSPAGGGRYSFCDLHIDEVLKKDFMLNL